MGKAGCKQSQELKDSCCRSKGVKQKSEQMLEKGGLYTLAKSLSCGPREECIPSEADRSQCGGVTIHAVAWNNSAESGVASVEKLHLDSEIWTLRDREEAS